MVRRNRPKSKSQSVTQPLKRKRRAQGMRRNMLKQILLYGICGCLVAGGAGYLLYTQLEHYRMNRPVNTDAQMTNFQPRTYKDPDIVYKSVHTIFPEMFPTEFSLTYTVLGDGRLIPSNIRFYLPVEAFGERVIPESTNDRVVTQSGKKLTMSYSLTQKDLGNRFTELTEVLLHKDIVRCQTYSQGKRLDKLVNIGIPTELVEMRYDLNIGCDEKL